MTRIAICRGCCCGTARRVPGLDHDAQVARLAEVAEVRVTDCLDVCDQANVIVVQPSPAGRQAGGRPVWLGLANQPEAADDIAAWIRAGGPGLADLPGILTLHVTAPPRRIRTAGVVSDSGHADHAS
ncbi:hypothetical protein Ssi03_72610 [Sphaerisporangium siamense]|uniref:(2Fe-2S) ferredoxin domain-containing protein n=1 Tax=Sphaerisporangium siamense TaxID=795645 RepID=A0A7W7D2X8_9ACTN|nr:(2Fe-2S) ferredoxin domain-containing protein [Sphaerisporangium siamense]MBB4699360.1 hypothetical protein [Sphaerisporangium siamense]GII89271.1 hypothetical protein Ssi03_72610 [Sphaerisporangium siamense]